MYTHFTKSVCLFHPISFHFLAIFQSSFMPREIHPQKCKSDQIAQRSECGCPLYRVLAGAPIARSKLSALGTSNLVADEVVSGKTRTSYAEPCLVLENI